MEVWLIRAIEVVGLGGVLVLLLALGLLRTNREVQEILRLNKDHTAQLIKLHEIAIEKQAAIGREAGAAKDKVIEAKDKELEYWRGTSIRLLEVGEKMAGGDG